MCSVLESFWPGRKPNIAFLFLVGVVLARLQWDVQSVGVVFPSLFLVIRIILFMTFDILIFDVSACSMSFTFVLC